MKAQAGICLHRLWVMILPWCPVGRLMARMKIVENRITKKSTMITVRIATDYKLGS